MTWRVVIDNKGLIAYTNSWANVDSKLEKEQKMISSHEPLKKATKDEA